MSLLYEKLLSVQSRLKVSKENFNDFGKYKYRNCEDILEAVKPLCKDVGAVITLSDKLEQIGNRFYIVAQAKFTDIENGESIGVTAYAREDETKKGMDLAQITGSTSSYARKYALNGLLAIDDTKDSDTTNSGDKPAIKSGDKKDDDKATTQATTQAPTMPVEASESSKGNLTQSQLKQIQEASVAKWGDKSKLCIDDMKKKFNVEKASQIPASKFRDCFDFIGTWKDQLSIDLANDDTSLPFDI